MAGSRGHIVIAGSLAQRPGRGGHAWVFLQYLLGFRRLGFDVLFLDELREDLCVDGGGSRVNFEDSWNAQYFVNVMEEFSLGGAYSLTCPETGQRIGLSGEEVRERVKRSAFILNVMGYLADPDVLQLAPRRVFLDIDPGFGQCWRALRLADIFAGHDDFVTIGLNIGDPSCTVPTCDLKWVTTLQPIVLERWPATPGPSDGAFTSIASWRGPFGPIEYSGQTLGLRVHEFRRFLSLPKLTGANFEVAMDIDPADKADIDRLDAAGWRRVAPLSVSSTPADYQRYIQKSLAEFMVAKNLYVQSRGGWFSDRSICYLASGRPVLAQDTGLANHLRLGQGLVAFSNLEEAAAGANRIRSDYAGHARAAREVAEEFFDSDKVLSRLLHKLGVN